MKFSYLDETEEKRASPGHHMGRGEREKKYISEITIFTYPEIRQPQRVLIREAQTSAMLCLQMWTLNDRVLTG